MQFSFNPEQQMLHESVLAMVEPWRSTVGVSGVGVAGDQLWGTLVEAGMTGVCTPVEAGGSGLGLVEAGCILEALGAVLDDGRFLMSAVLATQLLSRAKGDASRELLARLASSQLKASVLLSHEADGAFQIHDGNVVVDCGPTFAVTDCDLVVIVVRGHGSDPSTLLAFPSNAPDLRFEELPAPDATRAVHSVRSRALPVDAATTRLVLPRDAALKLRAVAAAALSAQILGGAGEVLELACQYARERTQFGGPIGRFQAIKHLLADDRVMLDGLRSLTYAALWQLSADAQEGVATAYAAKSWAADMYGRIASDAIQVHGAMGIAAESRPHRYLKRALVDRAMFGAPSLYLGALHEFNAIL